MVSKSFLCIIYIFFLNESQKIYFILNCMYHLTKLSRRQKLDSFWTILNLKNCFLLKIKLFITVFFINLVVSNFSVINPTQIDSIFLKTDPNLGPIWPKIGFKSGQFRFVKYNVHYWVEPEFGTFLRSARPDFIRFLNLTQNLGQPGQVSLKTGQVCPH